MGGNVSTNVVKGAFILTLAGLISKILSAGYRVPLQNMTGDLGYYIYQQIYPFLGMAIVLALYGFPSAISKVTNELRENGTRISFNNFYIPLLALLFLLNGSVFCSIFFNASFIASWMGDTRLVDSIQMTAFVFLLIPVPALLRGVFQGNHVMQPTALSQVGEQIVRISIIIGAAIYLVKNDENIYIIGQAGAIAAIIGAVIASIILLVYFVKQAPWVRGDTTVPWGYYWRTLLFFGIIAALNHMTLLVIQLADAFTLVPGLQEYGFTKEAAMKTKGVFDRGQPLIQLCMVFGSSFALALIPNLSRKKLRNNRGETYHYVRSALAFSFYLTIGATLGLILILPEANLLLFQDKSGTGSLRILMLSIIFCSLAITAASILQGLDRIIRTAFFILISLIVKWIGNLLLVPTLGITGSAFATVLALMTLCLLVFKALKKELPWLHFFRYIQWRALLFASAGMTSFVLAMDTIFTNFVGENRFLLFLYVIVVAIIGAMIYLYLLVKLRAFTKKQLEMLPAGAFLRKVQQGRHRNGN